jgi:multisubunit Na+/H+ antiporter MnhE subunit
MIIQKLHLPDTGNSVALFAIAALIGGLGWSGNPTLHFLALLYPFVYIYSRRRLDTLSAVFYYAASTWPIIPGAQSFFQTGHHLGKPIAIWIAITALGSLPWILFYHRRFLPLSAIAALLALALPPMGLVTVAHPLIATGLWFPGTRWFGLALPLVLMAAHKRLGTPIIFAILILASLAVHARFTRPKADPHIVAVNTNLGSELGAGAQKAERTLQQIAFAHPNALLIFPESVIPDWSAAHDARWASTFAQLNTQHTGILIGTTIPIPNTMASRNVLLSSGYTEHLSYVQRVPIPLGMWQIGESRRGFPLSLRFPATIRVWNRRAGVLLCYEQMTFWPAVETMARAPEMLIAPSNLYWARDTSIPAIQHLAAQDWADLWAIPLYEARNL